MKATLTRETTIFCRIVRPPGWKAHEQVYLRKASDIRNVPCSMRCPSQPPQRDAHSATAIAVRR